VRGRISLGISMFQDLRTVPMIVTMPLLASGEDMLPAVKAALGRAAAIVAAVVVAARLYPEFLSLDCFTPMPPLPDKPESKRQEPGTPKRSPDVHYPRGLWAMAENLVAVNISIRKTGKHGAVR
jgi:hypothetical protein